MLVSAIEGHRLWAPSYDEAPNPLLALEDRMLALAERGLVVDIACGTGRRTSRLRAQGANVFGVDLCEAMLRRAASKPGIAGRVVQADAACLPILGDVADLTLCTIAVGYFPSLDGAFTEMARITRPGGRVVVSDLHPDGVARGWTRSFRADGQRYEMRPCGHSVDAILGAADTAGLHLESQQDAALGESGEMPVLWIACWSKP
jgi:malonyl-CoA O-methyltransferase